jgi:hypothetical protein
MPQSGLWRKKLGAIKFSAAAARRLPIRAFGLPAISFPDDCRDALAAHSCGIGEAASGLDAAPKREHDADTSGLNPKFVTEGAATYRELRKRAICSSGV